MPKIVMTTCKVGGARCFGRKDDPQSESATRKVGGQVFCERNVREETRKVGGARCFFGGGRA